MIFKNHDDRLSKSGSELCCPWCLEWFYSDLSFMIKEPTIDKCPHCGGLIDVQHDCGEDGCSEWAEKRT